MVLASNYLKSDFVHKELKKFVELWNITRTLESKQRITMYRSLYNGKWVTMFNLLDGMPAYFDIDALYFFKLTILDDEYILEANILKMVRKCDLSEFYNKVIWDYTNSTRPFAKFASLEDLYQCFIALDNNI